MKKDKEDITSQINAHRKTILFLSLEISRLYQELSSNPKLIGLIPIEQLELSPRAVICLSNAGIHYAHEIISLKKSDLLYSKNSFGIKTIREIRDIFFEKYGINVLQ